MINWNFCKHEWSVLVDSQSHNEYVLAVECEKCRCPGEKDIKTGDVFWPTT